MVFPQGPSPLCNMPVPNVAVQPLRPAAVEGMIWADLREGVCCNIYTPDMIPLDEEQNTKDADSLALENGLPWPLGFPAGGTELTGADERAVARTSMHKVIVARHGEVRTCLRPVSQQRVLTPSRLGYQRNPSRCSEKAPACEFAGKRVSTSANRPKYGSVEWVRALCNGSFRSGMNSDGGDTSALAIKNMTRTSRSVDVDVNGSMEMSRRGSCSDDHGSRICFSSNDHAARFRTNLAMLVPAGRMTPRQLQQASCSLEAPRSQSRHHVRGSEREAEEGYQSNDVDIPAAHPKRRTGKTLRPISLKRKSLLSRVMERACVVAEPQPELIVEDVAGEPEEGHLEIGNDTGETFASAPARANVKVVGAKRERFKSSDDCTVPDSKGVGKKAVGDSHARSAQHAEALKTAKAIEDIILGGKKLQHRLPADKQTSIVTDGLLTGGRDLNNAERERLSATFMQYRRGGEALDDAKKDASVAHQTTVSWQDVARKLHGHISALHIHRLGVYLKFPKKIGFSWYTSRVGKILTLNRDQRVRLCFGLLDVDGDGLLGLRDVFAMLTSSHEDQLEHAASEQDKIINALFMDSSPIGIELAWDDPEVRYLAPSGLAEHQGIKVGDKITHVGGVSVANLASGELSRVLESRSRPLHLQLRRRCLAEGGKKHFFAASSFERLMSAHKVMTSTKVRVTIIGARGLRNADFGRGGSDPFCVVEIVGKPHTRAAPTKAINDSSNPIWNETRDLLDYVAGDSIKFEIRDQDIGSKEPAELLGRVTLPTEHFFPGGFDGELPLQSSGKGHSARLRLKVECDSEGGIGLSQFIELTGNKELPFLAPLIELLTGSSLPSLDKERAKNPPLKIVIMSASGLRNPDTGGSCDPYCAVDVPQKPGVQKVQSRVVNDTSDPVWNDRREIFDYAIGDPLRFCILGKEVGRPDELFGQVTVSGSTVAAGFDGELNMNDGGKGLNPRLRVKIMSPTAQATSSQPSSNFPSKANKLIGAPPDALNRHNLELRHVYEFAAQEEVGWIVNAFQAICDEDLRLRVSCLGMASERLFGIPSWLLAGQLHHLIDKDHKGDIGVEAWVRYLHRCDNDGGVALAFALYDLDGDGKVGVNDALSLAEEEDRLGQIFGHPMTTNQDRSNPICEEVRWIYGLVADNTDSYLGSRVTLDSMVFRQKRPKPFLTVEVCKHLEALGRGTTTTGRAAGSHRGSSPTQPIKAMPTTARAPGVAAVDSANLVGSASPSGAAAAGEAGFGLVQTAWAPASPSQGAAASPTGNGGAGTSAEGVGVTGSAGPCANFSLGD